MISSFLFARIVVNKTSSRKGGCLTGIGRGSGEGVGGVLVSLFRIWTDLGFFATDQTVFFTVTFSKSAITVIIKNN